MVPFDLAVLTWRSWISRLTSPPPVTWTVPAPTTTWNPSAALMESPTSLPATLAVPGSTAILPHRKSPWSVNLYLVYLYLVCHIEPICGINGITYFSPCHAGCTRFYSYITSQEKTVVSISIFSMSY